MKVNAPVRRATFGVRRWWLASITIVMSALSGSVPAATVEATVRFERAAPPALVVWIPGVTGWKPVVPTVVDQRFEAFHPIIAIAPPGGVVEFHNADAQQHNVFALDAERGIDTDLGLGAPGTILSLTVAWPVGSVVKHGCKIHPQMQLWIMALDSPFHAVGEFADGTLETVVRIPDVPADLHRLSLWAPRCEQLTVELSAVDQQAGGQQVFRKGKPVGKLSVRLLP